MWPQENHPQPDETPPQRLPPVPPLRPDNISFTQLDLTERFGDHERFGPEEWATTVPLNATTPYPESRGLPPLGASAEDTYRIARRLSRLRVSLADPSDGVYCPVCHIANVQLAKLNTPCPKCGRGLLRFGWD